MTKTTIDVGIDLGTTNSAIAVMQQGTPFVIPDNVGAPTTPSVVRFNQNGTLMVGHSAYQSIISDPDNTASEFKRWMGTNETKTFTHTGRTISAPELSAEILKRLRNNVQQHLGEAITSAVITVPAAFDLTQTAATQEAAALAGIEHAPLLQEPIAASLAYGFRVDMEGNNWLVYDLGGGTFDLALVGVRDGRVQVIDHEGDNYLGGKDLDWIVVEQILIPKLSETYNIRSFSRGNIDRRSDLSKLKATAEAAKIELSQSPTTDVLIETLRKPMLDDDGREMEIELHIHREEYESAIQRLVDRTIQLSRSLLERNTGQPVEAVLMVGGPTITPRIREAVGADLGIAVNFSANPLTVVAEGAALYAAAQPIPRRATTSQSVSTSSGIARINVAYKTVTDDDGAHVAAELPDGVTSLEISAIDRSWSSGQLTSENRRVSVRVPLARKGSHSFSLIARRVSGEILETEPSTISITRALTAAAAPIARSFGVVVDEGAGNYRTVHHIKKGTPLPARITQEFRTVYSLEPGQSTEAIQIHIVEGEQINPARNRRVGDIKITSSNLSRRLPAGNPLEVTLEITESRLLKASAYVPLLDETFDADIDLSSDEIGASELAREITSERERVADLTEHIPVSRARELNERLREVAGDTQAAQSGDRDAAQRAHRHLQEIQVEIDAIEDTQQLPKAIASAREESEIATSVVMEYGDSSHRGRLKALVSDLDKAVESRSFTEIQRASSKLSQLRFEILTAQPGFWIMLFRSIVESPPLWTNPSEADRLVSVGYQQISSENISGVVQTVQGLFALMPEGEAGRFAAYQNVGIRQ